MEMATITILPEGDADNLTVFSAVSGGYQATGRTVGEALNKLITQLGTSESSTTVIVQQFQPDRLFTSTQRDQVSDLMARWRAAREARTTLPPQEQAELERLVDEELQGTTERSAQILRDLKTTPKLRHGLEKEGGRLGGILEKERQQASKLHRATLLTSSVNLLLIALAAILLIGGLISSALASLIATTFVQAIQLLLSRREEAAHNRIRSLNSQMETIVHLGHLEELSDQLETPPRGKYREQTRAQ
jgi:hypothetical protein